MCLYFPTIPATFMHIPKTGGASLSKWASDNNIPFISGPEHADLKTIMLTNNMPGTIFTIVRNPYDRLVSQYHYVNQVMLARLPITDQIKHNSIFKKGFGYYVDCMYSKVTFADQPPGSVLSWWISSNSQVDWFSSQSPDIIIKLEQLDENFVKIQDLFQCYNQLPHLSKTVRNTYREYYTAPILQKVTKLYQQDIEMFNYDF